MRKIGLFFGSLLLMAVMACATTTTAETTITTPTSFLVQFEENGGSEVADYTASSQMTNLPSSTKRGFTMVGWYEDVECTILFNPETPRTDWTFTLYAKWTPLSPALVTFSVQGGSPIDSVSMFVTELLTIPTPPSKQGYAFDGWFIDAEGNSPFSFSTPLNGDLTLYAKWTPAQVIVTIERYTESLTGSYVLFATETVTELTESVYTLPTYELPGFSENRSHLSVILSGTVRADGSLVLKTYYDRNDYTISFDSRADLSISSITLAYETPVTEPSNPIRSGFTFLGWFSDAELTIPYAFTTMPSQNIILHAKWLGDPATLSFDSQGGSSVSPISAPIESPILPPAAPTRPGYEFDGWFTDLAFLDPFTVWSMPAGNITLHAQWTPAEFTVVFEEDGGTAVLDITAPYHSPLVPPEDPTKSEYVFRGWFTDLGLTQEFDFSFMPLDGITLYAKWISASEANLMENIIGLDEGTFVEATGVVFARLNEDQVGYYVYDSSGYLFVQDPTVSTIASIGNRLKITGVIRFWNGVPTLSHVSSVLLLDSSQPLPELAASSLDQVESTLPTVELFASPLLVRGVLLQSLEGFFLADLTTGTEIPFDPRMEGEWNAFINHYVQAKVLFSRYDEGWELGAYGITEPSLSDQEKTTLIQSWWDHEVASFTRYEEEPLQFPTSIPFGWGTIAYEFNSTNRVYIDDVNGLFKTVETMTDVVVPVDLVVGGLTTSWEWTISLHPTPIGTILAYFQAPEGEKMQLVVRVTMTGDEGFVLLEDATGAIYLHTSADLLIGDELLLYVRRNATDGFVYLEDLDIEDYEILSHNTWVNDPAEEWTASQWLALDVENPASFGPYVELRGFLEWSYDPSTFHEGFRLTDGVQFSVPIEPVTYSGFETLFQLEGMEVLIRGYIGQNDDGDPVLWFTGVRRELQLPEYSDQELVDMIGILFARKNAGRTFESFEEFTFFPYDPLLGGTITWTFPEGFAEIYDFEAGKFGFVSISTPLSIQFTISKGAVSKTFDYQTTLTPPEFTTISELSEIGTNQEIFVKGLVVYHHPDYFYLQDETGLVFVWESQIDCYAGDYIVLRCEKQRTDWDLGTVYLQKVDYDDENDAFLLAILSRDHDVTVRPSDLTIGAIVHADPSLESSYNHHVTLSGRLSESTEFSGYFELRRGEDRILVTYPDDYTFYKLERMVENGEIEVMLPGFLYDYDSDEDVWYLLWTGIEATTMDPVLTDEQKTEMIADWIEESIAGSVDGESSIDLPTSHPDFGGTIGFAVSGPNAGLIDVMTGLIQDVLEPTEVSAQATIVVASATRILNFTWTILPLVVEGDIQLIENVILGEPSEGVWVSGTVISAHEGEDGTTVLIEDSTGRLFVTLPSTEWFYSGSSIVGDTMEAFGFLSREHGTWEFRATEHEFVAGTASLSETFEAMTLGQAAAIDVFDSSLIGKGLEIEGLLRETRDGAIVLTGNGIEIEILACYLEHDKLWQMEGFPIRLHGFVAGIETSEDGVMRIALSYVDYAFGGLLPLELAIEDDQAVAQILLDKLDPKIDGKVFQPYDQWYLSTSFPYLETSVSFSILSGESVAAYVDSTLFFTRPDADTSVIVRMTLIYQTGTATRDISFTVNGFGLGTLDDLFLSDENLTELGVPMTVIYTNWGFCYFEYLDRIYYYDGFLPDWLEQNQAVVLFGKRTTIDGIPELTYEIRALGYSTDEYTLLPLEVDVDDLYEGGIHFPEHYLRLYGILGYDKYLDMFTLSANGKTVYIRETMEEGSGGEVYFGGSGGTLTRQDFRELLGEEVYLKALLSSLLVRDEFMLVDFRGFESELELVPLDTLSAIQRVIAKTQTMVEGMTFHSGEEILWMLPGYDPIRNLSISYEVASGYEDFIGAMNYGGAVGILLSPTDIDLVGTVSGWDYSGIDPVEISASFVFTVHLEPATIATVRQAMWGTVGEYYVLEGVVEYFFDDEWIILSDETGRIFVSASGYHTHLGVEISQGDTIRILGMRRTYENEDYVPILDSVCDLEILTQGSPISQTATWITVEEILELNYLNPDIYTQYVRIQGQVIFSGNPDYPSYDIREEGVSPDASFDYQMYSNTYQEFNDTMAPLVGSTLSVEGYLIGFEYIYAPFDWILMHVNHVVVEP